MRLSAAPPKRAGIEVALSLAQIELALNHARAAEIGGYSSIRGDDRSRALRVDQQVGQICTLGYFVYHYGAEMGTSQYDLHRQQQNLTPTQGDGGFDLPDHQLDVKGSLWRKRGRSLWEHRLAVRPKERHPGWIYVLAMTPASYRKVWLLGWVKDEDLPEADTHGVFAGAHTVMADHLQIMDFLSRSTEKPAVAG